MLNIVSPNSLKKQCRSLKGKAGHTIESPLNMIRIYIPLLMDLRSILHYYSQR